MSDYLQIDGEEFVHLGSVKRLRVVTDTERNSLAKLGDHVDAGRFNTRIDYDDNSKSYAPETIDDLAQQARLIEIDTGSYVPAQNVKQASKLTQKDRSDFAQRTGRQMRADFVTRIRTTAGAVLSTAEPKEIMRRMGQQPQRSAGPDKSTVDARAKPVQNQTDDQTAKSMAEQRDQVMQKAAPQQVSQKPAKHPEQ